MRFRVLLFVFMLCYAIECYCYLLFVVVICCYLLVFAIVCYCTVLYAIVRYWAGIGTVLGGYWVCIGPVLVLLYDI